MKSEASRAQTEVLRVVVLDLSAQMLPKYCFSHINYLVDLDLTE